MRAILHIGPMKTGTSSIQAWLHEQRAALRERGFLVPESMSRNCSPIASLARVLSQPSKQGAPLNRRLAEMQEQLVALKREVAAQPPGVHSVILSGELMGEALNLPRQMETLRGLLDPIFADYVVLPYLRRQDERAVSKRSTVLRHGQPMPPLAAKPIDYERMLANWGAVFGEACLKPRLFDRDVWPEGDLIADFAAAVGIPDPPGSDIPMDRNASLLPEAQRLLALLADALQSVRRSGTERRDSTYAHALGILNRRFSGPGELPTRAEAMAYYAQVAASNEAVRSRWFPERPALFREDFSRYPTEPQTEPPPDRVLEVAVAVLAGLIARESGDAATEADQPPRSGARRKGLRRGRRKRGERGAPQAAL